MTLRTGMRKLAGASKRFVSSLRRRLNPLVLYEFMDSTPHRPEIANAWHIIGDEVLIRKYLSREQLQRVAPSVRRTALDGKTTYLGVYKKRMVRRFRRVLRERGAALDVRYERPPMSEKRQFFLHVTWYK